jgi:hypothetical protein
MEEQIIEGTKHIINDKRNEALYFLSFLVWPFMTMLAALRHREKPWSKNIFWIFCIFFGLTFIISPEFADSARHAQLLAEYANADLNFRQLIKSIYTESSGYVDIVQPLITFLVSRVTKNPIILFTIFGFIFGYFYSRNIWYILGQIKGKITGILLIYLLTFALLNPIWNINGFRMWTAAQIFLFGTLPYLAEGNMKKLLWSGISIFFHFSFVYPLLILFLFIFLKNRLNIYLIFFIITSFIKEIDLQAVGSALSFLPSFLQPRISAYTNLEYAESVRDIQQSLNWYLPLSLKALEWTIYALTLFIYFFCRKFLKDRRELMTLFCFSLLLCGFNNIISLIPSGARFLTVSFTFMIAFFIIFISNSPKTKGLALISVLSVPLILFFCMITIRIGMDFFGLMTVFGNPFLAVLGPDQVPLIMGIKRLFLF